MRRLDVALLGLGLGSLGACHDAQAPEVKPVLEGLSLSPASITLEAIDGGKPTQHYTLIERWSDGQTRAAVEVRFEVRPPTLGRFDDATMIFTANGQVGGAGTIRAEDGEQIATAPLVVELDRTAVGAGVSTAVGAGVSTDDVARFEGAIEGSAEAVEILYPLDGAVMPQNVASATIQWSGGRVGDVLRIRWKKPHLTVTTYLRNDGPEFPDAHTEPLADWRAIALTEPTAPAELRVDRLTADGRAYASRPIRVRFAEAALEGVIYYRGAVTSRLMALDNRDLAPRQILPRPPLGCIGCHAVAGSGRYLAARFGTTEDEGGVFDLTSDVSSSVAATVFKTRTPWWWSTFSPDDRRILVSLDELGAGGMGLYALPTGAAITPLEGALPTGLVSHPSWSPDGGDIAYLANLDLWGGLNTTGDLYLLPVLGLDRFAAPTLRVAGDTLASEAIPGQAISYPSWSPDSRWLAFAHGQGAGSTTGTSAVYLIHRSEGDPVLLANASASGPTAASFQPRFSPTHQGGYYWLCYLSRRDYGNAKAGTAGTGQQHIWVSAIKDSAPAGTDPSEVGYWLVGQGTDEPNVSAYWARRACRRGVETCSSAEQCCSGACGVDGHCATKAAGCASLSAPCEFNADCCDGGRCVDGRCGGIEPD